MTLNEFKLMLESGSFNIKSIASSKRLLLKFYLNGELSAEEVTLFVLVLKEWRNDRQQQIDVAKIASSSPEEFKRNYKEIGEHGWKTTENPFLDE